MSDFPRAIYHKDGDHKIVASQDEAKKLGDGWSDKPNDKTIRSLRKASGAARTDLQQGNVVNPTEVY